LYTGEFCSIKRSRRKGVELLACPVLTPPTIQQPFTYTGREDDFTGLYYYRNRYYYPDLEVFTSQDPLGDAQRYVGGNPISFIDPLGLLKTLYGRISNNDPPDQAPDAWENGGTADETLDIVTMFYPAGRVCKLGGSLFKIGKNTREVKPIAGRLTGYTKHGVNQVISREGKGVNTKARLDAVKNPKAIVPKTNGTTKYVGEQATVVLNESGQVVTVWGRPRNP
jgi:RHS repeat-associated protein